MGFPKSRAGKPRRIDVPIKVVRLTVGGTLAVDLNKILRAVDLCGWFAASKRLTEPLYLELQKRGFLQPGVRFKGICILLLQHL